MKTKNLISQFLILVLISLLTMTTSCTKSEEEKEMYKQEEGIVINDGPPAVDGHGWIISIEEKLYEPKEQLDSEFLIDSLKVYVEYKLTGQLGYNGEIPYKQIEIKSIIKR